jgi:hypothetical protein
LKWLFTIAWGRALADDAKRLGRAAPLNVPLFLSLK